MRWFFCFHAPESDERLEDLVRVAVHTALTRTQLRPCCLCDGISLYLMAWLERRGVPVVRMTTPLLPSLERAWGPRVKVARGAFLRVHVPTVALDMGIEDEYVLYADTDVMFVRDPVATLLGLRPELFAVAPELGFYKELNLRRNRRRRTVLSINSGVMLMNLPRLRETYSEFTKWIYRKVRPTWAWDQTAYQRFYGPPRRRGGVIWDELPLRYNWKPCWGMDGGDIIHFHGPKPYAAEAYLSDPDDPNRPLAFTQSHPLLKGDFLRASKEWQEIARGSGARGSGIWSVAAKLYSMLGVDVHARQADFA